MPRRELLEHLVLGRLPGRVMGAQSMQSAPRQSRNGRVATLYSIAEGASMPSARGAAHGTRRRRSAHRRGPLGRDGHPGSALTTTRRWEGARTRRRWPPARRPRGGAVVVACPQHGSARRGPQAEKSARLVEGLRGGWRTCRRHTRRAAHYGRSGGEAARGRHGLEGAKARGDQGGGGRDASRNTSTSAVRRGDGQAGA